jgi:hypothetical protein
MPICAVISYTPRREPGVRGNLWGLYGLSGGAGRIGLPEGVVATDSQDLASGSLPRATARTRLTEETGDLAMGHRQDSERR